MAKEKVTLSAFLMQGLATMSIANLVVLSSSIAAFPSYTIENFKSNETVLSRPMTIYEVSILGSLTNLGALIATPLCGYIVNAIGRKYSAMLYGFPFIFAWLIISLTKSVPLVLASIGIAGFGAAGQAISSIYISEIAQDSIRGGLATSVISGFYIGLLLSYYLGGLLSYNVVAYVNLSLSVLYVVLLSFLKESPVYLVQKGKMQEAAKSIAFYRRIYSTSKEVKIAINKIKLQLDLKINNIMQGENDTEVAKELLDSKPGEHHKQQESQWQFLKKSPSSKRALLVVLFLMSSSIMMGAVTLQTYAEPLFKVAVPSMSPNLCSMLVAVDLMVASLLCGVIVDTFGRKFLMTYTSVASGVFTLFIGAQLSNHFAPHWFTAFLIYGYLFVYILGAATVPYVLTAEVFLPEVRGLCNSLTMAIIWLTNFVTLIIFNPLVEAFGLGVVFYAFTVICIFTATFSFFFLPETKGLPVDAIQPLFLKKSRVKKNRSSSNAE